MISFFWIAFWCRTRLYTDRFVCAYTHWLLIINWAFSFSLFLNFFTFFWAFRTISWFHEVPIAPFSLLDTLTYFTQCLVNPLQFAKSSSFHFGFVCFLALLPLTHQVKHWIFVSGSYTTGILSLKLLHLFIGSHLYRCWCHFSKTSIWVCELLEIVSART